MRTAKLITLAGMLALLAASCTPKETDTIPSENLVYREFTASLGGGTKTSLTENHVLWNASGEEITIIDADGGCWTIAQKSVSSDRRTATFAGEVPDKELSLAVYPAADYDEIGYSGGSFYITIPSQQTATAGSFENGVAATVAKVSADGSLHFRNIGSLLGITVNASNIQSAKIYGTEASGASLSGLYSVQFGASDTDPSGSIISSSHKFVELTGGLSSGTQYWAFVAPGTYSNMQVVFTDAGGRTATFPLEQSLQLRRNGMKPLPAFTIGEKDWDDYAEPAEFTLVTSESELQEGDEVLIVYRPDSKALGAASGTIRNPAAVTISGNQIASPGDATVLTLESGSSAGTWALKDGDAYLASTSSGNSITTVSGVNANSSWEISISSSGEATIEAQAGGSTLLQYNSGSPRFTCYKSSSNQKNASIFRRPGGSGGSQAGGMSVKVTTGAASGITTIAAKLSGSWSGATATVREAGFQIGLNASALDDIYQADITSAASGNFSVDLTMLDPGITYYYRAYVQLQDGSEIKEFKGTVAYFTTDRQQDVPTPGNQPKWAELPVMNITQSGNYMINSQNSTEYYAWHICPDVYIYNPAKKLARNYTVCYSSKHHCTVWVAAPRHSMYTGSAQRTDAYGKDPDIPSDIQYNNKSTGGGCNKGHMLGSAERTVSTATNKQVFYYSNIAPQLSADFNTGGGRWNVLEDFVDDQVCRDTLYEVLGCHFEKYTDAYGVTQNPSTISFGGRNDVHMPTMFYYVLLRTKSGNSGKYVANCSASELKCVAFVRAHANVRQAVTATELMSVSDLEKITGVTYFPNVPNAPKDTFKAGDWGL